MKTHPLLFRIALGLLFTGCVSYAKSARPILYGMPEPPHHASVLLMGYEDDALLREAQTRLAGQALLYKCEKSLVEEPPRRSSRNPGRLWDVVLIKHNTVDGGSLERLFAQFSPIADLLVWDGPNESLNDISDSALRQRIMTAASLPKHFDPPSDGDSAGRLEVLLKNILHMRSPPWANLPEGHTDPALMLGDARLHEDPASIPLAKSETFPVCRAEKGKLQFLMHPYIIRFDGKFWAMWSAGEVDEDGPGQFIQYATSEDGRHWSHPKPLAVDPDGPDGPLRWMPGGLYIRDGALFALGSLHEGQDREQGIIWKNTRLHRFLWMGSSWSDTGVIAEDCLVYYPPLRVEDGEFLVWRNARGHLKTAWSRDGHAPWRVEPLPGPLPDYRLSETSAYLDGDGALHLAIRDQGRTGFIHRTVRLPGEDRWTLPVQTNYPDATSKNFVGRLSTGWFYLINNPLREGRRRDLLSVSFSPDGWVFQHPLAVRRGAPEQRYPGKHKDPFSFQYADAIEHDGHLWIIYSTNKEDIEVTTFPLPDLCKEAISPK